jgi:hypothetical protein
MDQALSIMTEMQLNLDSVGLSNSISSSEFGKKKKMLIGLFYASPHTVGNIQNDSRSSNDSCRSRILSKNARKSVHEFVRGMEVQMFIGDQSTSSVGCVAVRRTFEFLGG